ncbi:thiamine-phosphate kinase [Caldalkalibacillus salinus]|uniref:thiamine-phosphate kinase n=1 Tax=Caldalkalibacillus salinus TaxID=2803787 RepID=UPI00192410C8|nr:thiamine-phosphate kinase [Caldalkalibacillus salinus]
MSTDKDEKGHTKEKDEHIQDEFTFIADMSAPFQTYGDVLVPLGDDAAVYRPTNGKGQIVCVDTMVEDIHFARHTMSPQQIGHKALAANISDIAAMGGIPTYFVIAVTVPQTWTMEEMRDIYRGMRTLADEYRIGLLGGDTTSNPHQLVISITAIGEVEEDVSLLRSNARPGDLVFLTGSVGNSAAGLDLLLRHPEKKDHASYLGLLQAHQQPQPHVEQGRLLAQLSQEVRLSLNDVSDGIASETHEIAQQSAQVDIVLNKQDMPLDSELITYAQEVGKDPYDFALNGGEDFVLVGTVPPSAWSTLEAQFRAHDLSIFSIGHVQEGQGDVWLIDGQHKRKLNKSGYNHFSTE